ncbi:MAG: NAD(P)/FAD-dependent oxidoreductase [Chloroflexi bacterium]|nr:NAD(P)/FAD-dependent oxidoreductase [Chloroflexota bacterium]
MDMKNQYDVVVIGAGLGGLTCGAFLAKEGLRVLVAEQHSKPGGCCTSFQRKGFVFDAGVDYLMGAEDGGLVLHILEELGLKDEVEFMELAPPTRVVGRDYSIPPMRLEGFVGELKKLFPGESASIDAFIRDCQAVVSETLALAEPAPDLLGFWGKIRLAMKFMFKSPKVRAYGGRSYQQALAVSFKEPRLRAIMGSLLDWDTKCAASMPMMVIGYPACQYPRGGAQALADVLARGVTKHGGELCLKTLVTRILIEDGRAAGVELADGTKVNSRYVVSNVDGRQTFLQLIGEQHLAPKFAGELKQTRLTGLSRLPGSGYGS